MRGSASRTSPAPPAGSLPERRSRDRLKQRGRCGECLNYMSLAFSSTAMAGDLSLPKGRGTIIGTFFRYARYASP